MKKVTNPELIKQLNGMKKVKNSELINALNQEAGIQAKQSMPITEEPQSKFMNAIDAINNIGGGLAKGVSAPISGLMQLAGMPKEAAELHPPFMDESSLGTKAGEIGGNLASYFAGGAALAPLKLASRAKALWEGSKVPGLATAAGIAPELAGNAAFGATLMPDNPEFGAGLGVAGVGVGKIAGKALDYLKNMDAPQYAKHIYSTLTKNKGPEENAASAVADIYKGAREKSDFAADRYNELFNELEKSGHGMNLDAKEFSNKLALAIEKDPGLLNGMDAKHKKLVESFLKNTDVTTISKEGLPAKVFSLQSAREAHRLQSALKAQSRQLKKAADSTDRNKSFILSELGGDLSNALKSHLEKQGLHEPYEAITNYYRQHVVPYNATKTLREIKSGTKTGDTDFLSSFKRQNDANELKSLEADEDFMPLTSSTATIANHLGDEFKKKLIAEYLRPAYKGGRIDKDILLNKLEDIESQGLGPYLTDDIKMMRHELQKKNKAIPEALKKFTLGATENETFRGLLSGAGKLVSPKAQKAINKGLLSAVMQGLNNG